jgi:hypothetical protein
MYFQITWYLLFYLLYRVSRLNKSGSRLASTDDRPLATNGILERAIIPALAPSNFSPTWHSQRFQ